MLKAVHPSTGSKDGAQIAWIIEQGSPGKYEETIENLKKTVHLGISVSDHSFWRFEYGTGHIEPANPEEAKDLADWFNKWQKQGRDLSDFIK